MEQNSLQLRTTVLQGGQQGLNTTHCTPWVSGAKGWRTPGAWPPPSSVGAAAWGQAGSMSEENVPGSNSFNTFDVTAEHFHKESCSLPLSQ